jgi:tetratricopeptide (TPR) repeat protein
VIVIAAAGAAAAAYRATASLRSADGWAPAVAWAVTSSAPVAVLFILARIAPPVFGLTGSTAEHARLLASPRTALLAFCSSVLVGFLIHQMSSTADRAPLLVHADEDVGVGTLAKWLAAAFAVYLSATAVGRLERLDLPNSASSAARIVARAEADALQYPRNARAHFVYGFTLMELNQFDSATVTLRRSLSLDPDNADANNAVGWMAMKRQKFAEALPYLRAAIALEPRYGHAWHNLGWSLSQSGRYAEAAAVYDKAIWLKPSDAQAHVEYSWVLRLLNQREMALRQMQRAVHLRPNDVGYRSATSELLRNSRRFAEAVVHLEDAIKVAPSNASLWGELGLTRYLMQDAGAAAAAFEQAERLDPAFLRSRPLFSAMYRAARRGSTADVGENHGVRMAVPIFR